MTEQWPIATDYTMRVYETDNGPGGMSWELYEDGHWTSSSDTLERALALVVDGYPVAVYRYTDYEAACDADGNPPEYELRPSEIRSGGRVSAARVLNSRNGLQLTELERRELEGQSGIATVTLAVAMAAVLLAGWLALWAAGSLAAAARGMGGGA